METPPKYAGRLNLACGCLVLAMDTRRVLLLKRSSKVDEPLTWGTIGGFAEKNERRETCAVRTVRAETGYRGKLDPKPLYVYRNGDFAYHTFLVKVDKEFKPTLNWESAGYKWVDPTIPPRPLHYGVRIMLGQTKVKDDLKKLRFPPGA